MASIPRITQQFIIHMRGDTAIVVPKAKVTAQYLINIRGDTAVVVPKAKVTAQFIIVIRSVTAAPTMWRPQVISYA